MVKQPSSFTSNASYRSCENEDTEQLRKIISFHVIPIRNNAISIKGGEIIDDLTLNPRKSDFFL